MRGAGSRQDSGEGVRWARSGGSGAVARRPGSCAERHWRARSDVPVARGVWGVPGRARALTRGSAPEQAGAAAHTHDDTYTRPQDGLLPVIERIVS